MAGSTSTSLRPATSRPVPTTRSRTSGSSSARHSTRRSATAVIDVSGRPLCVFEGELPAGAIEGFDTDLAEEFLRAVAGAAKLTLHVQIEAGTNAHHMVEAAFKAFARALRAAVEVEPGATDIPSTKGLL
jgi:imidazoleglycerol-phosphate dehydratase